jgi:hypothetical protein
MKNTSYTRCAPFEIRLSIWEDTVKATQKHIQYGEFLQSKGANILNELQAINITSVDDGIAVEKLYQKVLVNIEKGIKIEQDSREKLIELHHCYPKKF